MCGRYSLTRRQAEIIERFGVQLLLCREDEVQPRFNVAPSQMVPVIVQQDNGRAIDLFKWGLVPFWTKEVSSSKALINCRVETMAEKPFFRSAVARRRCLIPADGFYEWRKEGKNKVPLYIHMPGRPLFSFAGLWDEWHSRDGDVLRSCTIITTAANTRISTIHDRMPVIIRPEHESLWLDGQVQDLPALQQALAPLTADELIMYQVSSRVNSAMNDDPNMVEPAPLQTSLFD
jgi:putative SOS response-associated peptidase YedK